MMSSVQDRYPGLIQLAAGSFNPEWDLQFSTAQEVVVSFKEGAGSDLQLAIADLDAILASPMSEEELGELWSDEMAAAYYPASDGLTFRQWFTELRRFFAQ